MQTSMKHLYEEQSSMKGWKAELLQEEAAQGEDLHLPSSASEKPMLNAARPPLNPTLVSERWNATHPFSEGDAKLGLQVHILKFLYTIGPPANYCLLRSITRSRAHLCVGEISPTLEICLTRLDRAASTSIDSCSVRIFQLDLTDFAFCHCFSFVSCSRSFIWLNKATICRAYFHGKTYQ